MDDIITLAPIARIHNDFPTKFGIPRQSGLAAEVMSTVVFEPEYRDANALRGLEGYSHIWLIWGFSAIEKHGFKPTVLPPRLGGNTRMGVFATRSPFRPNPIGLSCVRLEGMEHMENLGTVLTVSGADMMDGTPIYDIKPYLPYTDCRNGALGGFAADKLSHRLNVSFDDALLSRIPEGKRAGLISALAQDPRPGYQSDPELPYGFEYAGFDVRFRVDGDTLAVFDVIDVASAKSAGLPPPDRLK